MTTLRGDRCQCAACGALFNSTRAFDMHRVGKGADRSCLTAEQMRNRGMAINTPGFWCTSLRPATIVHDPPPL
jgi:hypothetical protein